VLDNKITVISTGPGGKGYITIEALKAINEMDVVVGYSYLVDSFAGETESFVPDNIVSGTLQYIREHRDKKIGVLVSGDAGIFSLAAVVTKEFGRENVKIIPGVSSVQTAFARIGIPWQDAKILSMHGRKSIPEIEGEKIAVLCDGVNTPVKILKMIDIKYYNIYITEDLTLPSEKVYFSENIDEIKDKKFSPRSVVILIRKKSS